MKQKTKFKETEIGEIPEDWEVKELSKVGNIKTGRGCKKLDVGKFEIIGANGLIGYTDNVLDEGNLIYTGRVGTIGMINFLKAGKYWISDNVLYFKTDNLNKLKFVYYFLSRFDFSYLNVGSTQPLIKQSDFKKIKIALPKKVYEIEMITKILSDLDSKIELLQKQNQILEKIGQALFKHWFVDFESPNEQGKPYKSSSGEMVDSELGEIPKGWRIGILGDLLELNIGGDWGNEHEDSKLIPIISLRGVDIDKLKQNGFSKDAPIRWIKKNSIEKREITDCDILVGGSGLGPIGKSIYCHSSIKRLYPTRISYSNFCKRYTAKNNFKAMYCEIIISNLYNQGLLKQYFSGTSIPNLDAKSLLNHKIIIPTNELLNSFYQIINIKFEYLFNDQIQSLKKIRDSLLPKLMSGKIRVPVEVKQNA